MAKNPTEDANLPAEGPKRCGAKTRSGKPCEKFPVRGWNRCRKHGARGGRPIIHGRYSQVLKRFKERYAEALNDPDILDLRPMLAGMDIRIQELFAEADQTRTDEAWDKLMAALDTRSKRTEKAWEIRLRGHQVINAQDLALLFGRFAGIIVDELGEVGAAPILTRIEREIMRPVEEGVSVPALADATP